MRREDNKVDHTTDRASEMFTESSGGRRIVFVRSRHNLTTMLNRISGSDKGSSNNTIAILAFLLVSLLLIATCTSGR